MAETLWRNGSKKAVSRKDRWAWIFKEEPEEKTIKARIVTWGQGKGKGEKRTATRKEKSWAKRQARTKARKIAQRKSQKKAEDEQRSKRDLKIYSSSNTWGEDQAGIESSTGTASGDEIPLTLRALMLGLPQLVDGREVGVCSWLGW
jgi:hypothetical protein